MAFAFHHRLEDGALLMVRAVHPGDRELLRRGFEQLSQRSRYFRFLNPLTRLPDHVLDRFAAEGDALHLAVGAIDLGLNPAAAVGIARYERAAAGDRQAEMAVTIVDEHQRRGIGTVLLGAIAWHAVHQGIDHLLAVVHADNRAMIRLAGAAGGRSGGQEDGARLFTIPIFGDARRYPSTSVGDGLRAVYRSIETETDDRSDR